MKPAFGLECCLGSSSAASDISLLGSARSIWFAFAVIVLAHSGTSTVWVFSTTLLHLNTEDRFLGRIFGADLAISMFVLAAATWIAGQAIDAGISPRAVAVGTGAAMFVPVALWALALRLWRPEPERRREITT